MSQSSSKTCWTCRIRKKRCDRKQPACSACRSLDITCHDGNSRPSWVNDDCARDEIADQIRAQVREKAESRREKSYVKVMPLGRTKRSKSGLKVPTRTPKADKANQEAQISSFEIESLGNNMPRAESIKSDRDITDPALLGVNNDIDLDLEIIFLDYAFPFLFPFYRPSLFEGGRGWLLATLRSSMPLFHTAMCFSTYFFTLVIANIEDGQDEHEACRRLIGRKLTSHINNAINSVRKGINDLHVSPTPISVFGRAHLLEGVVQLLVFDTNIARTTEWSVHIAAAVSLLKEILELPEPHGVTADLTSVFAMMQRPEWSTESPSHRMWNSDQSALRFHVAFIIFADIISATTLGDIPKLRGYYTCLIKPRAKAAHPSQVLELGDFVGCQGWILLLIADIAVLKEKKDSMLREGMLFESNRIAADLRSGMACLNAGTQQPIANPLLPQAYVHPETLLQSIDTVSISLIWAHATVLYLFITTFGWREQDQVVQENVSSALRLLQDIQSPAILRSLAWPFFVTGCLATKIQEADFRQIASKMGSLSAFGTLNEALKVLEKVWNARGERDEEIWDFISCFKIMGAIPLLI
ncbi:fungal-specific transcription factor domain-containing protein [Trichoderma austrokoningii]